MTQKRTRCAWLISAALTFLTLAIYWPAQHFEFLVYDDPVYVSQNPKFQQGLIWSSFVWAFCTGEHAIWCPMTRLSHLLDWTLFGGDAGKHHLTNVLLHVVNSVLLFVVWRKLTGAVWRSALVAALFALHPLRVESVAWVTERKDVLSGFFFLLTLWAYARYAEGKSKVGSRASKPPKALVPNFDYIMALLFFACGLMAKTMLVTLPFVLLLMDYWPLKRLSQVGAQMKFQQARLWPLLIEKIPFLLLSVLASAITVLAHRNVGAIVPVEAISIEYRLAKAAIAYLHYIQTFFWPVKLAVPYPSPERWSLPHVVAAFALLGILSIIARVFWRRAPAVAVGWLWFLSTLVPVIGLVGFGEQAYADRFTYLPMIGFSAALIWGIADLANKWKINAMLLGTGPAVALAACGYATSVQLQYWRNNETLFTRTLGVTTNNVTAHNNLALHYVQTGQPGKALEHATAALRISPNYPNPHVPLAFAYWQLNEIDKAYQECLIALRVDPQNAELHNCFGAVLAQQGKLAEACDAFGKSIALKPQQANTQRNWGLVLTLLGKWAEAIPHFEESVRIEPRDAQTHYHLGDALQTVGRAQEARASFSKCLELQSNHVAARSKLDQLFVDAAKR